MLNHHKQFTTLLLCDDDDDDRFFFRDAVKEVDEKIIVNTVNNCEELITTLDNPTNIPDLLFLDLNMPRSNGKQCLEKIRKNPALENLPVIIYSTSVHGMDIDETYSKGANLYIQKSNNFTKFKKLISTVLSNQLDIYRPDKEKFVLFSKD